MKSLICSDLHDHIKNFESALMVASTSDCDSVICLGDLCAPFMLDVYHRNCQLPFHFIFGNNDGDRYLLTNKTWLLNNNRPVGKQLYLHGEYLLAAAGHHLVGIPSAMSIALYHYPEMASAVAASGKFNVVFCGHSHRSNIEKMNDTLFMNPGSVMGYIPGPTGEEVKPSCIIINWENGEVELIEY